MRPVLALTLSAAAPTPPVDGARAYLLRSEGRAWEGVAAQLGCSADAAKSAAGRYAGARELHVFG